MSLLTVPERQLGSRLWRCLYDTFGSPHIAAAFTRDSRIFLAISSFSAWPGFVSELPAPFSMT